MLWTMFGNIENNIDMLPLEEIYTKFNGKYTFFKKTWNTHISRCVENQLDYTHLSEVHKTTIGRGFTIPENPKVIQTENTISIYKDEDSYYPLSSYIFPNSWILNISDKMKIIVYFVPVSINQTIIYICTFRQFLNSFLIKTVVDFIMNISNKFILSQDQKVVESQSCFLVNTNNEVLMKHDKAIRLFRNMWQSNQENQNNSL